MAIRVSIIINNYNYAHYLRSAIDSALGQTYQPLEVIVVDDGSSDESHNIINSYGERIVPIFKENGGQASAFNAGFAKATGELIHFLDADDVLLPEAVDIALEHFNKTAYGIFQAPLEIIDANGRKTGKYFPQTVLGGDPVRQMAEFGFYDFPATSGNVFAASVLKKLIPIPEADYKLCADSYLCVMAPFLAPRSVGEKPIAHYRMHGSNLYIMNAFESADSRKKRDIQMVLNTFQKFRLIASACETYRVKLRPRFFCGRLEFIYRWVKCRCIYRACLNEWPVNNYMLLYYAFVSLYRDKRGLSFNNIKYVVKIAVMLTVPKAYSILFK